MKRTVLYTTLLALGLQLVVATTAQADKGSRRGLSRGPSKMSSMSKGLSKAKMFKAPATLNRNVSSMKLNTNKANVVRRGNTRLNNLGGRLPVKNLVGKPNLGGVKKPFPTKLPVGPVTKPPFTKPPITLPPGVKPPIGKPPIKLPPGITKPPITLPPGVKPPIGKPPIKLPPGIKPPIKLPPGVKPPFVDPPVVKPPVVVPPICPPVDPPYCPPYDYPDWCFPGWTLPSWCYTQPYNCPPSYGTGIVDVSVVNNDTIVEATAPAEAPAVLNEEGSVEVELPQVPAGSTITVHGSGFGEQSGVVTLVVNELTLPTRLVTWEAEAVTIALLPMHMEDAVAATLIVLDAEGKEVQRNEIQLVSALVSVASN